MRTNNETNSCAFFVSNEQVESVEFIDRKNSPYGDTKVDWNNIETTYPVLKPYLDKVGTKVDEVSDQKTSALSLINSIINGFMWRRAAWALGGVMICFVVAALPALTGNGRNRQGQRGASASTRHRTTQHTSRSHRPRRR